jgi:outer membrane protein OmpA-like peptidoglycan-associated protein
MFWKTFATILCIAAASMGFGWTGQFHLVVGLTVLALVAVVGWKLKACEDDGPVEPPVDEPWDVDDRPGIVHGLFIGGVQGAVVVGILALTFVGLSSTPLRALIEGPDCQAIVGQIDILETGQAYARIVEVVETSVRRPLGLVCRQTLLRREVRALLEMARNATDAKRLAILEKARQVVTAVEDPDLKQLVASDRQAEMERLATVKEVQDIRNNLAKLQEKNKEFQETNRRLEEEKKQWEYAANALKTLGFNVEETPQGHKVILTEKDAIRFGSNKADLDAKGRTTVRRLAEWLKQAPYENQQIRVTGHTDASGNNHGPLSRARAASVADELVLHGVHRDRLDVQGVGADEPAGDNDTAQGRVKNRRVEILILKSKASEGL